MICHFRVLLISLLSLLMAQQAEARPPALQQLADGLADKITKKLKADSAEVPTAALVVELDQTLLGKADRICQQLEKLLQYRLESGTGVERVFILEHPNKSGALTLAERQGASLLIRLVVGMTDKKIHASADLVPIDRPFWVALIKPRPKKARHHVFEAVTADEEVTLLLGASRAPPALGTWRMRELLYVPKIVLDLGVGNLDDKKGLELVLLTEKSIEAYSFSGNKHHKLVSYDLTALPSAQHQTRDAKGSLVVADFNRDGVSEIFFKMFGHHFGEVLSYTGLRLRPLRKLKRVPMCLIHLKGRPTVIYGTPEAGTNRYSREILIADINSSSGKKVELESQFSTLRCWQTEEGLTWIIVVDDRGNLRRLDPSWQVQSTFGSVGVGAGIFDLDRDAWPDLVLSKWVWPMEPDSVQVVSKGEVVWRNSSVLGSIVAVTGGDWDGSGKIQALIAAVDFSANASRIYLMGR